MSPKAVMRHRAAQTQAVGNPRQCLSRPQQTLFPFLTFCRRRQGLGHERIEQNKSAHALRMPQRGGHGDLRTEAVPDKQSTSDACILQYRRRIISMDFQRRSAE